MKVTQNDIVKYIYKEVSATEKAAVERELFGNQLLEDDFYSFVVLKQQLDKLGMQMQPSKKTLDKILQFSKNFNTPVEKE